MSDRSTIEWTDASYNPLRARRDIAVDLGAVVLPEKRIGWHCEHVSEGCRNCYAEGINRRLGTGLDFKPGHRGALEFYLDEKTLLAPLRWKRPRKIFLGSMTDAFGDWVTDEQLDKTFAVAALCPQHTLQVLTKRPERMRAYMSASDVEKRIAQASVRIKPLSGGAGRHDIEIQVDATEGLARWPLPNVWLGISAEDQPAYEERWQHLANTPAAIRFISYEPALGPINLQSMALVLDYPEKLFPDWVISGGESGPHARPANPQWFRFMRDQCVLMGIAYFHKQNGEFASVSEVEGAGAHHHFDDGRTVRRVGKKRAGRLLDGVEHSQFPSERA